MANPIGVSLLRNPITGIEDCCACAAGGNAAAAPPSSVMNARRLLSNIELPAPWVPQALGPRSRQVLAACLNHSESCERSQVPGLCQTVSGPDPQAQGYRRDR